LISFEANSGTADGRARGYEREKMDVVPADLLIVLIGEHFNLGAGSS
jgi:hypothetical protein